MRCGAPLAKIFITNTLPSQNHPFQPIFPDRLTLNLVRIYALFTIVFTSLELTAEIIIAIQYPIVRRVVSGDNCRGMRHLFFNDENRDMSVMCIF